MQDSSSPSIQAERVLADFLAGRRGDETLDLEALCRDHEQIATELRELYEDWSRLGHRMGGLLPGPLARESFFQTVRRQGSDAHAAFLGPLETRPGSQLGDYQLVRLLGKGGMGQVWEADERALGRRVALKLMLPGQTSDLAADRFAREARAGGRLTHPGIVSVYAAGAIDGVPYIAQELVGDGHTLADHLRHLRETVRLPTAYYRRMARFFQETAEALHVAHTAGVIHRDIKPQNILVTHDDHPKVSDFGLARLMDDVSITEHEGLVGTYYYMSPEQAAARRVAVDHRTDQFSLGTVFYEVLTLKRPFEGDTGAQIMEQIRTEDPPDPRGIRSQVPAELALICRKLLEKNPADRYPDMGAFAADLQRFLRNEPIVARPPGATRRVCKWVLRHPTLSAAIALGSVALLVTTALTIQTLASRTLQQRRADAAQVRRLADWADELWPAVPSMRAGWDAWSASADELLGRAERHRADLAALRARALPPSASDRQHDRDTHPQAALLGRRKVLYGALAAELDAVDGDPDGGLRGALGLSDDDVLRRRERLEELATEITQIESRLGERRSFRFEAFADQAEHDLLAEIVRGLDVLEAPPSQLIADVAARAATAERLQAESLEHAAARAAWGDAIASIADPVACPAYAGLRITPQFGLLPLGRDPDSRLWEFADLFTGTAPVRDDESGELLIDETTGVVLVLLPGATFGMGDGGGVIESGPGGGALNSPVHEVTLAPYLISKYELTQSQWERITGANPSLHVPNTWGGRREASLLNPVEQVSWVDCRSVLRRVGLALPTEARWEYAARGGTTDPSWAHRDELAACANIADIAWRRKMPRARVEPWDDGYAFPAAVGHLAPNPFGLHDVYGNVAEWCLDALGSYELPVRAGDGLRSGAYDPNRVHRGGSNVDVAHNVSSVVRQGLARDVRAPNIGVRPVRELQP